MSAPHLRPMSVAEYLRSEEASPVKREYVGGFVYPLHGATRAQAGASRNHVRITVNLQHPVKGRTGTRPLRLRLGHEAVHRGNEHFLLSSYYPDVMVVCTPDDPNAPTTYETEPRLLVEVTSRSTARNDRLAKYAAYTAIPSLHTYPLVEQAERRAYAYHRDGQSWQLQELASADSVALPYLNRSLNLDDIYDDVPV